MTTPQEPTVGGTKPVQINTLQAQHRPFAQRLVAQEFAGDTLVARGRCINTRSLPGLVATWHGQPAGVLLYETQPEHWQVVALATDIRRRGLARALLARCTDMARQARVARLWLVTTNNNKVARMCYQACGWHQVAVHDNAIAHSRRLQPEIPLCDEQGQPIRDEIEFCAPLHARPQAAPGQQPAQGNGASL